MKKGTILLSILGLSFLLSIPKVYALEGYYKNDNGVTFSKEEYDFLSNMFWDGCQELMTLDDYYKFISSNIMNGEIKSDVYEELSTRATSIKNGNRSLKITSSCNSSCFVSVTLTWSGNPSVKSYDVMGAYLDGTKMISDPVTSIGQTYYTDIKKTDNGFGVSVLLPAYNAAPVINQHFETEKKGTVYATCQHAMKNISLADSKNYTLSKSGYGGVFKFSGTAATTYDRFNGVSISL